MQSQLKGNWGFLHVLVNRRGGERGEPALRVENPHPAALEPACVQRPQAEQRGSHDTGQRREQTRAP